MLGSHDSFSSVGKESLLKCFYIKGIPNVNVGKMQALNKKKHGHYISPVRFLFMADIFFVDRFFISSNFQVCL